MSREMDNRSFKNYALDAEVAEKVMGWEVGRHDGDWSFCRTDVPDEDGVWLNGCAWRPSEDIAAAWEVVEKMRELGFLFVLSDDTKDGTWEASFEKDMTEFICFGRSVSQAICRAALDAVKK